MSTAIHQQTKPITLNMKVGDVLKEHPETLEVLVAQSPHFSRLKNPILRKIHGRLVTLAQAAVIAGLDPVKLVRTLNLAIGVDSVETSTFVLPSMAGIPEPAWVKSAAITVDLDVRDDQRKHEDPFQRIIQAVKSVGEGEVLLLRNTFEPLPLYDVLARSGFQPWAKKIGEEDWEVYFYRTGAGKSDDNHAEEAIINDKDIDLPAPTASITIDVRDLTPPEPMMKILDGLANLKSGETLLVHHRRRPVHLYPKLAELGYNQKTVELGPEQVDIYIHKS